MKIKGTTGFAVFERNPVSGDLEWVCTDPETNAGYRTSNKEVAIAWCDWTSKQRDDYYNRFATALHSVGL